MGKSHSASQGGHLKDLGIVRSVVGGTSGGHTYFEWRFLLEYAGYIHNSFRLHVLDCYTRWQVQQAGLNAPTAPAPDPLPPSPAAVGSLSSQIRAMLALAEQQESTQAEVREIQVWRPQVEQAIEKVRAEADAKLTEAQTAAEAKVNAARAAAEEANARAAEAQAQIAEAQAKAARAEAEALKAASQAGMAMDTLTGEHNWYTLAPWAKRHGVLLSEQDASLEARTFLRIKCLTRNIQRKKTYSEKYGDVYAYPEPLLFEWLEDYRRRNPPSPLSVVS